MRVIIEENPLAASRRAADMIARVINKTRFPVLGLATGGTPLGVYRELIAMYEAGDLDFSHVTTFNLDEYVGLGPEHPQSYRCFMQENLFDHINVDPEKTHVPDGLAPEIDEHCEQYEKTILEAGGIDLQLLGIGRDGHIAFNEPGSSLASRTRLKTLAGETVRDNARFFEREEDVPRLSITMGVGTILESRQCLILALGESKAEAIRDAIEGPLTSQNTASALQMHPDATAIVDEAAASLFTRREYYDEVEQAHRMMEEGKVSW